MDDALCNGIWNVLTLECWTKLDHPFGGRNRDKGDFFFTRLWLHFLKQPVDSMPSENRERLKILRAAFFKGEWHEVYDVLEFTIRNFPFEHRQEECISSINAILEREKSAYRFVGETLVEITSGEELQSVEEALAVPDRFRPIRAHLDQSLRLLADRTNPDYRNSIKEAISAVEAVCKILTGDDNATLSQALKLLGKKSGEPPHQALQKAFEKLYGYANDAEGIRHALLDEPTLDFADAKFMLVCCSAFVNYLIARQSA